MTSTIRTTWRTGLVHAIAAAFCISGADAARAAIVGPYTADANTLQLWHMDDGAAATSVANAVGGGLTMQGVHNGATLGNPAVSGFGGSLNVAAGATSIVSGGNPPPVPPHRAILLGAPTLSTANGAIGDHEVDNVTLNFQNNTTGAFTFEALIKFDSNYDPAANFRNVNPSGNPGTNTGNYAMEIISAENDGGTRPFQFRFDQMGFNAGGNTNPKLEFNNIPTAGNQFFALVPTTGFHAINNTDWFHVAVTYNGQDDMEDNLLFYWTKVDPSVAEANVLVTLASTGAEPANATAWANDLVANTVANDFAIGNEARSATTGLGEGENFYGLIDEVRMSDIARSADQFIFTAVPEIPGWAASLVGLLGFGGLAQVRRWWTNARPQ